MADRRPLRPSVPRSDTGKGKEAQRDVSPNRGDHRTFNPYQVATRRDTSSNQPLPPYEQQQQHTHLPYESYQQPQQPPTRLGYSLNAERQTITDPKTGRVYSHEDGGFIYPGRPEYGVDTTPNPSMWHATAYQLMLDKQAPSLTAPSRPTIEQMLRPPDEAPRAYRTMPENTGYPVSQDLGKQGPSGFTFVQEEHSGEPVVREPVVREPERAPLKPQEVSAKGPEIAQSISKQSLDKIVATTHDTAARDAANIIRIQRNMIDDAKVKSRIMNTLIEKHIIDEYGNISAENISNAGIQLKRTFLDGNQPRADHTKDVQKEIGGIYYS